MELILLICLIVLIFISAFFSGSETSMMAINRYKLRHLAKQQHRAAVRTQNLLKRPDRLLGVILIGNTFANIVASAIATILAFRLWGDAGIAAMTVLLTIVILIFAEVMPKTVAAYQPEKFAFPASFLLKRILWIIYPLVWSINLIANTILKCLGMRFENKRIDPLSLEEIRSVVDDSKGQLLGHHRHMLLGILDLETATIADCLVHKNDLYAVDLNADWPIVLKQLMHSPYSKVPVYRDHLDNIVGILHLKKVLTLLEKANTSRADIRTLLDEPYYIPETITLRQQLVNFQAQGEKFAVVVDEYGETVGIVTLEDIVEEVMGEFTASEQTVVNDLTQRQADGTYLVNAAMTVRDVNRDLQIELPTDGPKTLNGLITEYLENMPSEKTAVIINGYRIEILKVQDKSVKWARISPHQQKTD